MPSGKRKAPAGAPRSDLSLKERRRRSAGALAAGLRQDSPPARAEPTTRAATKRASVQGGAGVAVDPEREWLAAQARRLEDAGDGTFEASVITLATAFDRNKDQVLDEAEWNELVHDMLCVRDGVAAVAPSTAKNAAAVLARDGFAGIVASGATGVGFAAIIALARRWCDVLLAPAVRASLGGPPRLKLLHDPTLMDDIVRLRELRALPRAPARPVERRWVFARQGEQDAEWVGQPLSSYQLEGQDGWHLCDHKNGEGVVYWWPAAAERSADATLVAMPIELLAVDPAGSAPSDKLQRTFSWPPPPAATTFTKIQDAMRASTDMFANEPSKQTTRETAEVAAVYDCVDRRLAELGLAAVEVGGEGDCFFRALAHQLYGNRDLHATIRAKTVAEMRRNAAQWRNYLPGDGPPDRRYKQYCDRMGVAGCYVEGNLEVFAAATANNSLVAYISPEQVEIYVMGIDAAHDRHFAPLNPDSHTRSATVVHYDAPGQECHYRATERAGFG